MTKLDDPQREAELDKVVEWVKGRFAMNDVPRFDDVVNYAHNVFGFVNLKKNIIVKALRLLDVYADNSRQQRARLRTKKNRPIIINDTGFLHADIGFFSVTSEYATPPTFRAGFLVAKDICSRFTYVHILKGNRQAAEMEKAFEDIFEKFRQQNNGQRVLSVGFDKERSIMSNQMQDFFKSNHVSFHPFELTASKSKLAEGTIRLIREKIARLQVFSKKIQWWNLIDSAVEILNSEKIMVDNVRLSFAPKDINSSNLEDFLAERESADPSYHFSQFEICKKFVDFAFKVGDFVRAKLITTSSQVLGTKRSAVTLDKTVFKIVAQIAYVTRRLTVGKAYRCKFVDRPNKRPEVFDQDELALALEPSV